MDDHLSGFHVKALDAVDSVSTLQIILDKVIKEVKAVCFRTDGRQWSRSRDLLFEVLDHSLNLASLTCAMRKEVRPFVESFNNTNHH